MQRLSRRQFFQASTTLAAGVAIPRNLKSLGLQTVTAPKIKRYKMYFEHYGDQKHAMAEYRRIPASNNATACAGCGAPCEAACRYRIRVRERLLEAHTQLAFLEPGSESL